MRTVTLTVLLTLSPALAGSVTVTSTGLPAGATGTATVGKTSVKLGSAVNLPNGTYAVQGAPIGVSAKVYVAKPLNVAIKGATTAKLNYIKLPPGSPDPLFGMGGQRKTAITGLPVFDHWYVLSSGPDLPVITSAGTSGNNRQQLVSLTGVALGPATSVQLRDGLVWRNPTPLIKDGSGYLAGVSDVFGTVVRYDSTGKQDSSWKTTPSLGPHTSEDCCAFLMAVCWPTADSPHLKCGSSPQAEWLTQRLERVDASPSQIWTPHFVPLAK